MAYLKRIFMVILLASLLGACQNERDDDDDDDDDDGQVNMSKAVELTEAEAAFRNGEYQKAVSLLLPLAKQGNPDAQYALGYILYEGLGVPQDRMQAYFWIQESALQGNASALLALEVFEMDADLPMDNSVSSETRIEIIQEPEIRK